MRMSRDPDRLQALPTPAPISRLHERRVQSSVASSMSAWAPAPFRSPVPVARRGGAAARRGMGQSAPPQHVRSEPSGAHAVETPLFLAADGPRHKRRERQRPTLRGARTRSLEGARRPAMPHEETKGNWEGAMVGRISQHECVCVVPLKHHALATLTSPMAEPSFVLSARLLWSAGCGGRGAALLMHPFNGARHEPTSESATHPATASKQDVGVDGDRFEKHGSRTERNYVIERSIPTRASDGSASPCGAKA